MKKVIFIGTDAIGVQLLEALHHTPELELALVVTGQDKSMGRKMLLTANPIKQKAIEHGLPVYQPEKVSAPESVAKLKALQPDFLVVMAYGQIVSQEVLDIPRVECLNVHTSLLPKYRGASPIQSALLNGDEKTGVSLMRMVKAMDAGPVYAQFKLPIAPEDTAGILWERLSQLSANEIPQAVIKISENSLMPAAQDESQATYIQKISKADGEINWSEPADLIHRKVRAFNPWPSAFTFFEGKRLKLHKTKVFEQTVDQPVGTAIELPSGIGVVTGGGVLELLEVQLEGKKRQFIQEFLNGNRGVVGVVLGES